MNARELRNIADKTNEPYTLEYVQLFCHECALRRSYLATFDANRWTDELTKSLMAENFSVVNNGAGSVRVGW